MEFKELMALARGWANDTNGKRRGHEETDQAPLVWEFSASDPVTGDSLGPVAEVAVTLKDVPPRGVVVAVRLDLCEAYVPSTGRSAVLVAIGRAMLLVDQIEGSHRDGLVFGRAEVAAWLRTRVRGKVCAWDGLDLDPDV
jgi:hypothetical protein